MGDKLVKFGFSEKGLEMKEKIKALFVWDAWKCIVWVFSFQVNDQLGKFMIPSKVLHGIRKSLPAYDGREMTIGLPVASRSQQELVTLTIFNYSQLLTLHLGSWFGQQVTW